MLQEYYTNLKILDSCHEHLNIENINTDTWTVIFGHTIKIFLFALYNKWRNEMIENAVTTSLFYRRLELY